MTDATHKSVSDEALNQAASQNKEVLAAEGNAGATVTNEKPASTEGLDIPAEEEVSQAPPKSARDIKMDEIAAKRTKQVLDPEVAAATAIDQHEDQGAGQGGNVTIKVDGEETEVPAEKVLDAGIRTLQKESAADKRLEEAGVKMSELDVREQNILLREQELKTQAGASDDISKLSPAGDVSTTGEMSDDEANELVDDLYSGNKEKAGNAVKKLAGRNIAIQGSEEQVYSAEQLVTMTEQRIEAKSTLSSFYNRFPDIQNDKVLRDAVNTESLRIKAEHPDWDREKLLMESGKAVTEKYGGHEVIDETGFGKKADRKAQTDTVTGADVARRPQQQKPAPSRKSVIADIKSGRRA